MMLMARKPLPRHWRCDVFVSDGDRPFDGSGPFLSLRI